jgi:uncharacterized protein (TIGR01777 family)
LPPAARAVGWDSKSADGWGRLADGADAIVNLAGSSLAGENFLPSRWTPQRRHLIRQSRLDAGKAVVDAVIQAKTKPAVVIQSSAIGYYGMHDDETITTSDPPGDDFLAQVCVDWEQSTAPVAGHGVRHVVTRTGLVLSTEDGSLPRIALPIKLFVGGPFGNGKQWWSWIHMRDEVRAIRFLLEHPDATGPYNLVAPNPVRSKTFGRTLARILGRPYLIPVPGFAMRLLFGDVASVILEGQRVLPQRLSQLGFTFDFPEIEAALRDLYDRSG